MNVSFFAEGRQIIIPLVCMRDVRSKWEKFCTFFSSLARNQWPEFGRGQAWSGVLLFATSQPHPHAHDHRRLTDTWAGSEQVVGQGRGKILGCERTRYHFWLNENVWKSFATYRTYVTFYRVNISSGKLGGRPRLLPNEALTEKSPETCWPLQASCAWAMLWNIWVGKSNFSWEEKLPNESGWKSLRALGLSEVKQGLWLTERWWGDVEITGCPVRI